MEIAAIVITAAAYTWLLWDHQQRAAGAEKHRPEPVRPAPTVRVIPAVYDFEQH